MADQSLASTTETAPAAANLEVNTTRSGASPASPGTARPGNGTPRGMRAAEVHTLLPLQPG